MNTCEIPLTRGYVAIVDAADYKWLALFTWYRSEQNCAVTAVRRQGRVTRVMMHRLITDAPSDLQIDHINGDRLDNRRSNLRVCTPAENSQNRRKALRRATTSQYKGVYRQGQKWKAIIHANGKRVRLGSFLSEVEAAHAYDVAARYYFGEFAHPNFPDCLL